MGIFYQMTESYGAKATAKKEAEKSSNTNKNKVDKKRESEKPFIVLINTSTGVSLRQL